MLYNLDVEEGLTLTIERDGASYLPDDMAGTRHPHAFRDQNWTATVRQHDLLVWDFPIYTPAFTLPDAVAASACSFVEAAAERYTTFLRTGAVSVEGWLFDQERDEWCYQYVDRFERLSCDFETDES